MSTATSRWRTAVERFRQWPVGLRWGAGSGAASLFLFLVALAIVPPIVRTALVERAEKRGLTAKVGAVRLGLGRIWLRDVAVTDSVLPGTGADIAAVEVAFSLLGPARVRVHGARVRITGSEQAVIDRYRSLREGEGTTEESVPRRSRRLDVDGVDVVWKAGEDADLFAWGLGLAELGNDDARLSANLVRVRRGGFRAEIRGAELDLGQRPERRVERVDIAQANLRLNLGQATSASSRTDPTPEPTTPPAASALNRSALLAAAWAALRRSLATSTGENFRAAVVGLSVEVAHGAESLRIGPSRLGVARADTLLTVEVVPHAANGDGGTPLRLGARIPLGEDPIELEISGGPVSLAALGVRDGDFGLVGVREARLDAEGKLRLNLTSSDLELTSRGRLENARLYRAELANHELSGIRLGWRLAGQARLDGSRVAVREGEFSLGEVRAELSGEIERSIERTHVELRASVPLASCNGLLEALPRGAAPLLTGVRMAGTFGLKASVAYDSAKPGATSADLEVTNECRVTEVPAAIAPQRFRRAWLREVKGPDGLSVQLESGPGSVGWTSYEEISPHMETAIIVCEDGGFFVHHGFAYGAIESSIRQNLMAGRFLRGASTVSMQLAKNLYLGKEKTLSRKLQEAVLTLLLEQQLSKHELMELYLNVIEFGPGIYGIRDAARYYFNEEPRNLSLGQALYLASILPNPDSQHFLPDGRVSDTWSRYLQKLMQIAHRIRRITDDELEQGLAEHVAFRKPNPSVEAPPAVEESGETEPAVPELEPPPSTPPPAE